ncbi:ent-kaurenoic acid oxidase 2-like [Silene latifolia]|uniref:ent-kaurenoic acid oxidase 2-like n=1 Tax=Silene latifolia TaxID=37657 RepID=UPI003D7760D9
MVYVIHALVWPLIACLVWWWNEIWYATAVKARCKLLNAKLPPGHLGFPIFGEYFTFLWYGKNVGAYKTYLYGSPGIIACAPSLCKRVLTSSTEFAQGWPSDEVLGPYSVTTIHGSRHQHIKGFLSNEFNPRAALARFVLQFQPYIVTALHSWSQMGRINAFYQIKKVTLDYMARYMGGIEVGLEADAFEKLFSGVNEGVRAQPWNFPGTPYRHALKCRKKLTKRLNLELMKKKKDGVKMGVTSDLMDGLMQTKDKDGRHLSDEEVVDNVLSNIAISYIGIAYPVVWSMYFLAKNPHVLQKLREENMEMAKEKNGADVTYEDTLGLKYTNKVVEETIRIASISGFIFKKATEDIEVEGFCVPSTSYLIPKGWMVLVWLRYLHTDPSNFEDPMTFNPDRWEKKGTWVGAFQKRYGAMWFIISILGGIVWGQKSGILIQSEGGKVKGLHRVKGNNSGAAEIGILQRYNY